MVVEKTESTLNLTRVSFSLFREFVGEFRVSHGNRSVRPKIGISILAAGHITKIDSPPSRLVGIVGGGRRPPLCLF